ncbi:stalk domain-containing protein [Alkaliphilus peptidifermentans]|uniref:Copper amine oxidase N-terminal domain-containing protein n=1 Tax=Alkaliphilus peptidifermentans DSM 18978 TaxID=1120976 RepID=A0A1G5G9D3_9FIRM|nr:stalk domain-containing protein [Alkaliphilus peptidifermentans]SCY48246.1 Copper amine oxidase N-terminal domain-containing protein [Alkaliphilus peptidifermentans DSM 18978]
MLKKALIILLISLFLVNISSSWGSTEFYEIKAYINDIKILLGEDQILSGNESFIYKNKIFVSLRDLSELLQYNIEWDETNREVVLSEAYTKVEPCNPFNGEAFIYGQILKIDRESNLLHIEQHLDHNSREIFEALPVLEDAVIIMQRNNQEMAVYFDDLRVGDVVGIIVNEQNKVRAVIIDI